jgi:membrane-associated protease RseP (regulator of RpoE activity)
MKTAVALTVLAAVGLMAWADPKTTGPNISDEAIKAEARRQEVYVLQARWRETVRVTDIGLRLRVANQDLCPERRGELGFLANTPEAYNSKVRDALGEAVGLRDGLTVLHVSPGGPAAAAGLQPGDVLVSMNGVLAPTGKKASEKLDRQLSDILKAAPSAPVTLAIRRAGLEQALTLTPVMACGYTVVVEDSDELNAFADGKVVHIKRPILKLVSNDDELALVIAHELAHNGQHHIQAKTHNARIAGLGGLLLDGVAAAAGADTGGFFTKEAVKLGAGHASVEFEQEADYVGMYYMARAGFSTAGVENLWRKMAVEAPESIFIKSDHPVTPQRFLAIAAATQEIEAKRAKGEALTPNVKPS